MSVSERDLYSNISLYKKINEKRKEMFEIADKHGMESDHTLSISIELDLLINEYLQKQVALYK